MKIYITGDSHAWPLLMGCQRIESLDIANVIAAPIGAETVLRMPFFAEEHSRLRITADGENVRAPGDLIPPVGLHPDLCVVSACFHTAHLLWDYFTRAVPLTLFQEQDWIPLSDALLRAIADQSQSHSRAFILALRRIGLDVILAEAPKLFRHNPNLANFRPEVVHYIDRIYRNRAREWMGSEGVRWVDVPAALVAGDGYMLDAYRSAIPDDKHHGNADFGIVMMREVLKLYAGSSAADEHPYG